MNGERLSSRRSTYLRIPVGLLEDLDAKEFHALCVVVTHMDANGHCDKTQAALAAAMGCSTSTTRKRLRQLEDEGLLSIAARYAQVPGFARRGRLPNRYTLSRRARQLFVGVATSSAVHGRKTSGAGTPDAY